MFKKIRILSLTACAAFLLQSCHSDDDALFDLPSADAPREVAEVDASIYTRLRTPPVIPTAESGATAEQIAEAQVAAATANSINQLFVLAATVSGRVSAETPAGAAVGTEPCQVRLRRMSFDTVGGKGEATKSTGVVMVPFSTDVNSVCNEPRPVVLYAHGTTADSNYDLSKIITDSSNPANSEGMIMLAMYASEGYIVIAPNYAGYGGSDLGYHPYVDEVQQSTEMIDALNHVKTHADDIGANMSSKLFITGLSQGGYVAMATHKALQAKGETVTASVPVSGPYALGVFLDVVMSGQVNGGATTFAPMYLTALEKASDIYENESEVYAVANVENALPAPGKSTGEEAGLPAALFNSAGFEADEIPFGFGTPFLLADSFRADYVAALGNPDAPATVASKVRGLAYAADMQDWSPTSPLVMCGAANDPVVFYGANTSVMSAYWDPVVGQAANPLVGAIDLAATPAGNYALIQGAWQNANVPLSVVHQTTGVFCAGAALATFRGL